MSQAYVLFDRDGTLIKHVHYLIDPSKVELLANSALGLKMLKNFGFRFGIITNQSVINRGLATEDQVNAVNNRVIELFQFEGIDFDFILYCPHTPDEVCDCRKPAVALGQQAINEGLPENWTAYDDDSKRIYYHNSVTKKSIWTRPT